MTERHPHPSAVVFILPCIRVDRHADDGQIDADVIDISALCGRVRGKPTLIVDNGPSRSNGRAP